MRAALLLQHRRACPQCCTWDQFGGRRCRKLHLDRCYVSWTALLNTALCCPAAAQPPAAQPLSRSTPNYLFETMHQSCSVLSKKHFLINVCSPLNFMMETYPISIPWLKQISVSSLTKVGVWGKRAAIHPTENLWLFIILWGHFQYNQAEFVPRICLNWEIMWDWFNGVGFTNRM